ncbi:TIGR02270 family protein [Corallococcus sp. bb12-1]|uniref:TIGR02270 family protein n=1 Tax=Corallococcus sp. bb12-1 TaxID=2996784 RepID=UPI00226F7AA9|nr:TIGR02270 family protein [Corallococcus sp. bb12-1]
MRPMAAPPPHHALPISWEMLETHLDESGYLWGRWRHALVAPDHVLEDVTGLEERLLAHVDALVLAGPPAMTRLLVPALRQDGDPGRFEAAALALLLQETSEGVLKSILDKLQEEAGSLVGSVRQALRLAGGKRLELCLRTLLTPTTPPPLLAAALDALGTWRVKLGPELSSSLRHEVPEVRAAAFRCMKAFSTHVPDTLLEEGLRSTIPEVCEAALEVGLIGGNRLAWRECRRQVTGRGPHRGLALKALAIAGGGDNQRLLFESLEHPTSRRECIRVLGLLGTVDAARTCLELMRQEPWTALAAEAFSTITGRTMEPADDVREATAEDEDDDALHPGTSTPEATLPVPDVSAVEAWWKEQARGFNPMTRYIHGQPFGQAALLEALREASMYRRNTLAPVLELRTRGELALDPFTWTRVQLARMEAANRLPAMHFSRSLDGTAHG